MAKIKTKKCDYCNGTGRGRYMTVAVACPNCDGLGKVIDDANEIDLIVPEFKQCPSCGHYNCICSIKFNGQL